MPIKAKVVPLERRQLAAQGRLGSAGPRPIRAPQPQDDDSASSTSSDSDASSSTTHSSKNNAAPRTTKSASGGRHADPTEDFAQHTRQLARQEWLYATGQIAAVPTPPPKSKASPPVAPVPQPHAPASRPPPGAAAPQLVQAPQPPAVGVSSPPRTAVIPEIPKTSEATFDSTTNQDVATRMTSVSPPKTAPQLVAADVAVVVSAADLVTDEEEAANPGRREYLRLLDLLGDGPYNSKTDAKRSEEEEAVASPPKWQSAASVTAQLPAAVRDHATRLNVSQLTERLFNERYDTWSKSDSDERFLALEEWNRCETLALMAKADGFDPGELHQSMRQSAAADRATRTELLQKTLQYDAAVNRLEQFVISDVFVRRVNVFLERHHPAFLKTKAARARGEYDHVLHGVWGNFCNQFEALIVADLKVHVDNFDEEVFFESLLEWQSRNEEGRRGNPDDMPSSLGSLSFAAWEVLLSLLRFDCFCDLMDEFIDVHYGVTTSNGADSLRSGAAGVVGALRRTSPPPSEASSSAIKSASTSTRGSAASSLATTASSGIGPRTSGAAAARLTTPAVGAQKVVTKAATAKPTGGQKVSK